jgi:hypothetical protein
LLVCAATSSIEQIDMVESVKGTPNFSAARAALISPSADCIPVSPTGASATGIATSCPAMARAGRAVGHVHRHALAQPDLGEIAEVLSRKVCSVQLPDSA